MSKKLVTLISFVLVFGFPASASADLVGHWKLDDGLGTTAVDATGNGHDGTLMGNPQWVEGYLDGGLQFSGSPDKVDIPYSADLNPENEYSVSVWVNLDPAGSNYRSPVTSRDDGPQAGYIIYCTPANTWQFWTGSAAGGWNQAGSPDVELGQWTHVAISYLGGAKKLYINGELAGESNDTMALNTAQVLRIGAGATEGNGNYFFQGTIDDVRVYNHALTEAELAELSARPRAEQPDPVDGAKLEQIWVALGWRAGDYAASHDVYMSDNFDDVNDRAAAAFQGNQPTPFLTAGFFGFPFPDGLVPGTTYYWRVDEINNDNPDSPWQGPVWSFWIPPTNAYSPSPSDGAQYVDTDATLDWSAGLDAKIHYIHFGDNFDDVNNAAAGTPATNPTFTPGTLEKDKTYYWRVDESNPPNPTIKGKVWSFTTVPDIQIADPNLVGWWTLDEGMGLKVLDWSGHGRGGTLANGPQWVAGNQGNALYFDGTNDYVNLGTPPELYIPNNYTYTAWFKVGEDINGDSGAQYLLCIGSRSDLVFGVEDGVGIEGDLALHYYDTAPGFHSVGVGQTVWSSDEWHMVAATKDSTGHKIYLDGEFRNSDTNTNDDNYATSRMISIGAMGWNNDEYFRGTIDDVRIYNKALTLDEILQVMRGDPLLAWNPNPANHSTSDVVRALPLTWSAGDSASQHAVYLGTDKDAVAGADTSDTTGVFRVLQAGISYTPPEGVQWAGGPYYWRVDEHNTDGTVTKGNVWTFTVADYILVDDFESYNDIPDGEPGSNLVYMVWIDGYDNPNVNGSNMGYLIGASMETGNVHGGNKSVPFQFNNALAGVSEVVRTFSPAQDWAAHGVITLSIWFAGNPANVPGQLYVKINGVKVPYDSEAGNLATGAWQVWNIDLTSVGVNLQSITSLTIGIDGFSAQGTLLLDDIRLYQSPRELITPVQPDPAGLLGHWNFDEGVGLTAQDSSGNGNAGSFTGSPQWVAGKSGMALEFNGDDSVDCGDVLTITDGLTIACWVNPILLEGENSWVARQGAYVFKSIETSLRFTTPGIVDYTAYDTVLGTDTWQHVAVSFVPDQPGGAIFYLNGVEAQRIDTTGLNAGAGPFVIGNNQWDQFFEGKIDDVRVYQRTLSLAEIAGLAGRTQPFDKPF